MRPIFFRTERQRNKYSMLFTNVLYSNIHNIKQMKLKLSGIGSSVTLRVIENTREGVVRSRDAAQMIIIVVDDRRPCLSVHLMLLQRCHSCLHDACDMTFIYNYLLLSKRHISLSL